MIDTIASSFTAVFAVISALIGLYLAEQLRQVRFKALR